MAAEYHEAFWVAVAAAAPVLGLGYFLVFDRLYAGGPRYLATQRMKRGTIFGIVSFILLYAAFSTTGEFFAALGALASKKDDDNLFSLQSQSLIMYIDFLLLVASAVVSSIHAAGQQVNI